MTSALAVYRDDGPVAHAHGRLGRRLPVPAAALALAAVALVLVPAAAEGAGASDDLAVIAIAWAVVLGGLSRGRSARGSFRWLVPPAIRLTEYAGLLWLGSLAGGDGLAAAFALIAALAFRHYDLVYRLRHRGAVPARWVDLASLGWEGRLLLGCLLLKVDALPAGFYVLAGVLGVVFVGESIAGWTRAGRGQLASVYEEEEDEGQ